MKIDPKVLEKLSGDELGDGSAVPSDSAGDDRSGRYWLVKNHRLTLAIKIALITGRPLLLEGPSGIGKSSLARAISETLGWTYYETIVTSQTRLETLTGSVDLVRRLHDASRNDTSTTFQSSLEAFLEMESLVQPQLNQTLDHKEGVAAFKEKRKPKFVGR